MLLPDVMKLRFLRGVWTYFREEEMFQEYLSETRGSRECGFRGIENRIVLFVKIVTSFSQTLDYSSIWTRLL